MVLNLEDECPISLENLVVVCTNVFPIGPEPELQTKGVQCHSGCLLSMKGRMRNIFWLLVLLTFEC